MISLTNHDLPRSLYFFQHKNIDFHHIFYPWHRGILRILGNDPDLVDGGEDAIHHADAGIGGT